MKKALLLTGHNGFLGKVFLDKLNTIEDLKIFTLSRSNNSNYSVDLSKDIPEFDKCFDIIIHNAGFAHTIPKTKNEELLFNTVNVVGTANLLLGLSKIGIPKNFVFISSVSVYGLAEGINIDEGFPLLATDPYGKSKIEAERLITKWCFDNNVICTILRLPLVVGNNPPGNLGYMIQAIKKGYYFNISGGYSRKSMVLISDVAGIILKASEIGGVFNLTDGYHPSFQELSKVISKKFGKSFVFNIPHILAIFLAKFGDFIFKSFPINSPKLLKITSTLTFDDSKARSEIGWNPSPVLENFDLTLN
jgi:nucleoside-diphosphate-sugar epimerase